jgi:hypothetical protein
MKKQLLLGAALLLCMLTGSKLMAQAAASVDPFVYTPRGANQEMTLTSKWMYSKNLQNYNTAADLLAPANFVRGATVKDGIMLFIDRNGKQIIRVDGATGARLAPRSLASNLFTYMGRNKANTADSLWTAGLWGYQDIKKDNAGNILVGNIITSNTGRFQVWKVNMTDGTGTLVIDQADLATLFPAATTMRFDAFGVWGDVNGKAIIMAANASASAMEAYKWVITNGVAGVPTYIELDNSKETGKDFAEVANLGSAPQIFPLDENFFYVDGNATLPVLCDMNGNVVDGFKANISKTIDAVTVPGTNLNLNQGHNGLAEFEVNGKYFIVMAATSTAGVPSSAFRLYQFADANKEFSGLTCLWTFPRAGMGSSSDSNPYRTAMPMVEVSGDIAKIYLYTGEVGYGMYEFNTAAPTSVNNQKESNILLSVTDRNIVLSETVARVEVYNTAGQRVGMATNVSEIAIPATRGVFVVNFTDNMGARKVQKVVIP